jgi:hypothetical protein
MKFILLLDYIIILVALWLIWPIIIGAPYVPTPMNKVRRMLEIARLTDEDVLYDLGSGDGRIIINGAKMYSLKTVGIEADPIRYLWSKLVIFLNNLTGRVNVIWGNFNDTSLSDATVVTIYQRKGVNRGLKKKFLKELRPGARIVSYMYEIEGWTPFSFDEESKIYLYVI